MFFVLSERALARGLPLVLGDADEEALASARKR